MKRLTITMFAVLALAPLASSAAEYQYIISGDPAAAAAANSSSAASSGMSLTTDALTAVSASRSLEARFRTWCVSIGKALRSDDWTRGLLLIFR